MKIICTVFVLLYSLFSFSQSPCTVSVAANGTVTASAACTLTGLQPVVTPPPPPPAPPPPPPPPPVSSTIRTDLLPAPQPATPAVGGLLGAGKCFTEPDFHTKVCRLTDSATFASKNTIIAGSGGSGDTNPFSPDSKHLLLGDVNGNIHLMNFDPGTMTAKPAFNGWTPPTGSYDYSYKNDAILGIPNKGTAVWKYDTSGITAPEPAMAANVASCLPAGFATTWVSYGGSNFDETTFAAGFSNNGGQGGPGALYVAFVKAGVGCQVLNTATGAITANGAGLLSGQVPNWTTLTDSTGFTIHNVKMSKSGDYLSITPTLSSCVPCANTMFFWQRGTLNVVKVTTNMGGHFTGGFSHWINNNANGRFMIRSYGSANIVRAIIPSTLLPSAGIVPVLDTHLGWSNVDANDTAPFCLTSYTTNVPVPNVAWYNEVTCVDPTTGVTSRYAHTFTSVKSHRFNTKYAIGAGSQDGRFYIWSSDWMGTLGSESGAATCTIGTDCRGDVFVVQLK